MEFIICRLHRSLPLEMRALGDQYVKDEFRRHKQVNPAEAHMFMQEWTVSIHAFLSPFQYTLYVLDLKNVLNE